MYTAPVASLSGEKIRRRLQRALFPNPTGVADAQPSMILYDDHGAPSDRLFDIAARAIQHARNEDLSSISSRMTTTPRWPDLWPGEHYRLLAGIVRTLRPAQIVEVGTYQGLSALTLAKHLPRDGRLVTYDIVPYASVPGHVFRPEDFSGGRLVQVLADLADERAFESNRAILEGAELIFVDASKDGVFEKVLLERFETVRFRQAPLVVFDDIRVWNMLGIWRGVTRPKLDLTSFGHWSGTGLIDWQG